MNESHNPLAASCAAAITAEPIQPSARGLGSLVGRIADWAKTNLHMDEASVTQAALQAWDNTVGGINFPQIPDYVEVPAKQFFRNMIPGLIALMYAGS